MLELLKALNTSQIEDSKNFKDITIGNQQETPIKTKTKNKNKNKK